MRTRTGPAGADRRSRSERGVPTFRHLVFDLDGTLVDSAADLVAAVNAALARVDLTSLPRDAVVALIGHGTWRLVEGSVQARDPAADGVLVERAYRAFREYYAAHLLDETGLYAGVGEMLDELSRAGVVLSVLTNKPRIESERILEGLGVAERFERVVGGDDVEVRKPSPDGLLRLVREAGLPPLECLLIGDSDVDLHTARAAGVPFCGVTWGFRGAESLRAEGASWLVDRPSEILARVLPGRAG